MHRDELRLGNNQGLTGGGRGSARRRRVSCRWSLGGGTGTGTWAWGLGAAAASCCFLEGEREGRSLSGSSHDGLLEAAMAGSGKRQLGR